MSVIPMPIGSTAEWLSTRPAPDFGPARSTLDFRERIAVVPQGPDENPNYCLFVFMMAMLVGCFLFAAALGILAACCSWSSRTKRQIEARVRKDIEGARKLREGSPSQWADDEDDEIEKRTEHLINSKVYEGREQRLYTGNKKDKLTQG
jgi:hypothetical protein